MGTCYPFVHSRDYNQFNSMRVRNCWSHLQATLRFGVFPFIPISVSSPLKWGFYLVFISTRLGITFDPVGCLLSGVMTQAIRLLWLKNINPERSGEKVFYPHPISRSGPDTGNPSMFFNPTLCAGSLKSLGIPYEGSHVLKVFLINTKLYVT